MRHTDNPDAVFDIGVGVPEGAESWTDIVLGFAFYAFHEDINQNYFRRYDESGIEKPEDFEPDPDLAREDMMEKAGN